MSEPRWALSFSPTMAMGLDRRSPFLVFTEDQGDTFADRFGGWEFAGCGWRRGRRRWWLFGPRAREKTWEYRPDCLKIPAPSGPST